MKRIRLTWVATHPSQYLAPFLRHLTASHPELAVTALYASVPNAAQHGREFGVEIDWGVPLLDGYRSVVMRTARPDDVFAYDRLRGIDVPGVTEALRDTNPDVVLIPGWHSMFLLRAISAARRLKVPLMYRGDSHLDSSGNGVKRVLAHTRARWLLGQFTSGLAVGVRARAYLHALGLPEDCVFDVRHCVDNDFFRAGVNAARQSSRCVVRGRFGLPIDAFTVLFVGKLASHKRVDDLIAAAARFEGAITLHIVGSGPEESFYREAAARAGVAAAFSGFLNQHDLLRAYASADCLALPSRETWGMVCNEALASGLPLVVSDAVGSAPDLVEPGVTGEVFRHGDVDALARAISRVRDHAQSGHDFASRCHVRADGYSFTVAGGALASACRSTLAAVGQIGSPRLIAPMQKSALVGGNEKSFFELFTAVGEHGGVIHCLVNRWDSARIRAGIEAAGATWSYSRHWYPIRRRGMNPVRWLQMTGEVIKCSADLLRASRRRLSTHVIFPDYVSLLLHYLALPVLRYRGVRIVLKVANAPEAGQFYERLWRRLVFPAADVLVANSQFTSGCLAAYGAPRGKLRWTYQTAPAVTDALSTRNPSTVVYIGQLLPDKGVGFLLDALEAMLSRGVDARLEIAADLNGWLPPALAEFRSNLLARAQSSPLKGAVHFCGWREDVTPLLANAAVHCAPSLPQLKEAMGRVVIEAKATGTPSVVFPSGALPEMVHHGVDGWVCDRATVEALVEGLEWYLHHPDRVEAHGQAARADVARFSRPRWLEFWSAVLGFNADACTRGESCRA